MSAADIPAAGARQAQPGRHAGLAVRGFQNSSISALPAAALLCVFFVLPLSLLLWISVSTPQIGLANYKEILHDSTYYRILRNTFVVSALVVAVTLAIGYPVAWLLAILPRGLKKWLLSVILLSMWTNLLARTYAWMVLLQSTGVINRGLMYLGLVDAPLPLMNNLVGVTIGMTYIMLPFVVLPIHATLSAIEPALMQAASICGARPSQVFFRILLPLSLPGIGAAGLMVFVMSLGYYVTPALLGGTANMMLAEMVAEQMLSLLNWGMGSAAAFVLLAITLVLYSIFLRYFGFKAMR